MIAFLGINGKQTVRVKNGKFLIKEIEKSNYGKLKQLLNGYQSTYRNKYTESLE